LRQDASKVGCQPGRLSYRKCHAYYGHDSHRNVRRRPRMLKRIKNPDVTKALANIVWLGLERLTQIAVAIAISGLLARYFGPDIFGKWQYANTLLLVLSPITWVCGAEILVPTIVNRPPGQLGTVLGSAFVLRMGVSTAALVLTWIGIAAGFTDPLVGAMLAGLAVTMLFREPFVGVINAWLQSMTYSKPQLLTSMLTAVVKAALVYALVRAAASPARFGWLWALEAAAIGGILMLYYMHRHGGKLGWHIDRSLFRHFASAGTVFWLGLICMYLFLKLDRLMLERHISFADLGRYSAAQQLNENWITLALMLAQTIAPAFVYRVHDAVQLKRNVGRLIAMTAALMIGGAIVLDLLAGLIISRVFGPAYTDSISIFRWAVWLSVPAGIEAIGNLVVLKYQAKFVLLAKWLLALAVAFVVNLIAIPRMGSYGALIGLAAGYLAAASVNFYYIRFRLRV
jgi:PST family polysaccharide transporter